VLLIAGLVSGEYAREFFCEFKSDGIFEQKVEQSLLRLEDRQSIYFDDCEDALGKGHTNSGVYRIKPKESFRPFQVWCDMESEGGGWTLIQARYDGLIDFFRTWQEYRNGFGSVDSEHWLGNNFIRHITENNDYELKIELTGYQANEFGFAKYSPFKIGTEDEKYKLFIGNFTKQGLIQDSLSYHHGAMFSTKDSDNDVWPGNCADAHESAWWYGACYRSSLNGVFMTKKRSIETRGPVTIQNRIAINWRDSFNIDMYSLKRVEMKVRRMRIK